MILFLILKTGAAPSMIDFFYFFYNLIIFPIVRILELCYLFALRVSHNPGIAVCGVSAAVTIFTLPLYLFAERLSKMESDKQKQMKPEIDKINKAFSGDEKHFILSAYYRQNNYHPVYALRNSFGILIQIPFFIAAYSYLSHLLALKGAGFAFITDLGAADALFFNINLLPVVMTVINIISSAIYTKGLPAKEKIQLYAMALVFLLLLYDSPSGLVLYWTLNNVFSLVKNIFQKIKHKKIIIYIITCALVLCFDIYVLFFHQGYVVKKAAVLVLMSTLFFIPLFARLFRSINISVDRRLQAGGSAVQKTLTFILSLVIIAALCGLVIPSALIASSVDEFSFIDQYKSPFIFIWTTFLQSAGFFILWPVCIYYLSSRITKIYLTLIFVCLSVFALANVFLFSADYGYITNTLLLSNPGSAISHRKESVINIIVILILVCLAIMLSFIKRGKILLSIQMIFLISLLAYGTVNIFKISDNFTKISMSAQGGISGGDKLLSPVYTLSKNKKNVVIVMLDRYISAYVPYVFNENKALSDEWSGWTWYPNCVSFGGWTLFGIPAIFGGYAYTIPAMQDNPAPLLEKHNEALLLLPRLFLESNYQVAITDPSYANYAFKPDLSIFDNYPGITGENIAEKYTSLWLREHPGVDIVSVSQILKTNLINFSFFKTMPVILRLFMYDRGRWLTVSEAEIYESRYDLTMATLGKYAALDYLPAITKITDSDEGAFTEIFNELPHDPAFLQAPLYVPATTVTDKGPGAFANDKHFHVDMAAFLLLGKWFKYLKNNNVYDNTRIIIVSDHGYGVPINDLVGFTLPDGSELLRYNSLLMVKDFNSEGALIKDDAFMTTADVPTLATAGLIDNPVNPFTGKPLYVDKDNGVKVTTSRKIYPTHHGKYKFRIDDDEYLFVHDNIFDSENWKQVTSNK
jgi:YidC/Oxa1 family membrane protein insertase